MKSSRPVGQSLAVWLISAAVYTSSWTLDFVLFVGTPFFAAISYFALLVLMVGVYENGMIRRPSVIEILIACFMLWIILSLTWSKDLLSSFRTILYYALSFLLFFQVERVVKTKDEWRKIGWSFVAGAITAGLLLLYKTLYGDLSGGERATVGDVNANYIAYSIATAIPILLALTADNMQGLLARLINTGILILLILGIMVTGCRGALIAGIAGIVTYKFFQLRGNMISSAIGLAIIGLALFIFSDFLPEELLARIDLIELFVSGGENVNENYSGRLDVWPIAIQSFEQNIVGGIGVGAFATTNQYGMSAHNIPLTLAVDTGIIGLSLYLAIIIAIMCRAIVNSKNNTAPHIAMALLAVWIPIAMSGVWESSPVAWIAFALILPLTQTKI